jgi:catechol-2,3-dioxygenase
MEQLICSLVNRYESGLLNRRQLIQSLGLLVTAQAATSADVVNVASINHVSVQVSDVQRSVAFYTRTFGLIDEGSDANTARLASSTISLSV